MASRIDNQRIQNNAEELRNLKRSHELELKEIKLNHNKRIQNTELQNKIDLARTKDQGQLALREELERKENLLNDLKRSQEDAKALTDKEIEKIKRAQNNKIKNLDDHFKDQYESRKIRHEEELQALNQLSQEEVSKVYKKHKEGVHDLHQKNQQDVSKIKNEGFEKINLTKNEFDHHQRIKQMQYQSALKNQDNDFKIRSEKLKDAYQYRITKRENEVKSSLENLEKNSKLRQQTLTKRSEEKYEKAFKENEKYLQDLLSKREKIEKNFKNELLKDYKTSVVKTSDSFYHPQKLEHSITETKDGYIVKVPVKEIEKETIHLTPQAKEIKLTMTRNFNHHEDGNTMSKTETYVTKDSVEHVLDTKSVAKKYEDGNLIFTLKKA